jgi:TPR repeat protein
MSGKYKEILQQYNFFAHILKYDMRQIHRHPMIYYSFINKVTHQLSCDNINPFSIILRRVMAKQAVAFLKKILKKVEELCASGQCAAAIVPLQLAIYLGHLPSRARMAWLLRDGREGVARDHNRAFELVEEGTRLGCHHCQGVMAYCYYHGDGCVKDAARSSELARESSEKGSRYGQYVLGRLYRLGERGFAWDYDQAVAFYRLAAAQGLDGAQISMASMHYDGNGVARDPAEALRWFQLAAAQGHPTALYWVARCHERGLGVAVDVDEAIRWYRRAQAAGNPHATVDLQRLRA